MSVTLTKEDARLHFNAIQNALISPSMRRYYLDVPVVRSARMCLENNAGNDLIKWSSVDYNGRECVLMIVQDNNPLDPRENDCSFMSSLLPLSDKLQYAALKEDIDAIRDIKWELDAIHYDDLDADELQAAKDDLLARYPGLTPIYFNYDRYGVDKVAVDDTDIFDADFYEDSSSGFAYIHPSAWRFCMGDMPFDADRARDIIESECAYFTQYLRNEIFGVELWDVKNDELVESCWGFYGDSDADYIEAACNTFCLSGADIEFRYRDDLPDDDEFEDIDDDTELSA